MNLFAIIRVIGLLVSFLGLTMFLPVFWALHFEEDCVGGLLLAAFITLASGGLMYGIGTIRRSEVFRREALAIVGLSWIFVAAFGALPFICTGAIPSYVDCYFEAMSGLTTTGSTILTEIESLPKSVLFWRSFTHWLGGMGIIVLFIAILPFLGAGGKHLYKTEAPGLVKDSLTPKIKETALILWKIYLIFTAVETILLMMAHSEMDLYEALCHTFGTLATGGFSTKNASIAYFNSVFVELIIILFMFLAGVNFSLHFRAWHRKPLVYLRDTEWRVYAGLIIVSTCAITLQLWLTSTGGYESFGETLRYSGFQVVSIMTTTGYATADFNTWPEGTKMLLVLLMFVGGCGGSTGGGFKVIRWITLVKSAMHKFERVYRPRRVRRLRIGGTVIDDDLQATTFAFFFTGIFIAALSTLIITFSGIDILTSATAVVATLNNIGPGLERVGAIENFAFFSTPIKILFSFLMVLGRLEIYSILVLFAPRFWRL